MRSRAAIRLVAPMMVGFMFSVSGVVQAHFNLVMPPPADSSLGGGKGAPPCGPLTPASGVVTSVMGGHPLMLSLTETVMHPGHYRIALSVNSRTELPADPVVVTNMMMPPQSVSAPIQDPPAFPVLADGVFVHTTGAAPISFGPLAVMIPNITCDKCTLQVIEFMAAHGANPYPAVGATPAGSTFYYHHCADLKITADPTLPGPDAGATDAQADAGVSASGGATGSGGVGGGNPAGTSSGSAGGGSSATGGGTVVATGGVSASGGDNGNLGTGGQLVGSGGFIGTATGGSTGGAPAAATSGSSSGGCEIATSGSGGAVSLGVTLLGLMLVSRRRRS